MEMALKWPSEGEDIQPGAPETGAAGSIPEKIRLAAARSKQKDAMLRAWVLWETGETQAATARKVGVHLRTVAKWVDGVFKPARASTPKERLYSLGGATEVDTERWAALQAAKKAGDLDVIARLLADHERAKGLVAAEKHSYEVISLVALTGGISVGGLASEAQQLLERNPELAAIFGAILPGLAAPAPDVPRGTNSEQQAQAALPAGEPVQQKRGPGRPRKDGLPPQSRAQRREAAGGAEPRERYFSTSFAARPGNDFQSGGSAWGHESEQPDAPGCPESAPAEGGYGVAPLETGAQGAPDLPTQGDANEGQPAGEAEA